MILFVFSLDLLHKLAQQRKHSNKIPEMSRFRIFLCKQFYQITCLIHNYKCVIVVTRISFKVEVTFVGNLGCFKVKIHIVCRLESVLRRVSLNAKDCKSSTLVKQHKEINRKKMVVKP